MSSTVSIRDICETIRMTGDSGKANPKLPSIVEGIAPHSMPAKRGYFQITWQQALSILVERVTYDDDEGVTGYQRLRSGMTARRIAVALRSGKQVPPPILGLDNGRQFAVDGQDRIIAHVMERRALWVVSEPMDETTRRQVFADQSKAVKIPGDVRILADDGPIGRYVRDALNAKAKGKPHPWAPLIAMRASSTHLGAHGVAAIVAPYGLNLIHAPLAGIQSATSDSKERFSTEAADEAARLFLCLGTKATNPLAFRGVALHALTTLAVIAVRRSQRPADAIKRWERRMPQFEWAKYPHLRTSEQLLDVLVPYWNARLSDDKKVQR